jgi:hypothetical protein
MGNSGYAVWGLHCEVYVGAVSYTYQRKKIRDEMMLDRRLDLPGEHQVGYRTGNIM